MYRHFDDMKQAIKLSRAFNLRAGFNYIDFAPNGYSPNLVKFGVPAGKILLDAKVAQSNVSLIGEWLPFGDKFRIELGGIYAFTNTYGGKIKYNDVVTVNSIQITPSDIGYLNATVTSGSKLAPYIGIGFGRLIPSKKVSLGISLGAYYKGAPTIVIDATGLLEGNAANADRLNKNAAFQTYQWYPVGNLCLAFKL